MMDLLTVDETAKLLKVAPVTVRRYIAAGRLPAVRVGRSVRVRRESVGALLKPVTAKKLVKRIKDTGMKVQSSIMEDQIRVTGKKIDDLQKIISLLETEPAGIPLQFENFRN